MFSRSLLVLSSWASVSAQDIAPVDPAFHPGLLHEHLWSVPTGATLDSAIQSLDLTQVFAGVAENAHVREYQSRHIHYETPGSFGFGGSRFAYRATGSFSMNAADKVSFFLDGAGETVELKINGMKVVELTGIAGSTLATNDAGFWMVGNATATSKQYITDLDQGTHTIEVSALNPSYLDLTLTTDTFAAEHYDPKNYARPAWNSENTFQYGLLHCPHGYLAYRHSDITMSNRCYRCSHMDMSYGDTESLLGGLVTEKVWRVKWDGIPRYTPLSPFAVKMDGFDVIFATEGYGHAGTDVRTGYSRQLLFTRNAMWANFPEHTAVKATSMFTVNSPEAFAFVTFILSAEDDIKVFVDGHLVVVGIDHNEGRTTRATTVLSTGTHSLELQYYKRWKGNGFYKLMTQVGCNMPTIYGDLDVMCPEGFARAVEGPTCEATPTAQPTAYPTVSPTPFPTEAPTKHDGPVDCAFSDWGKWSACSKLCEAGTTSRTRTITQEALDGGAPCVGDTIEARACNTHKCEEYMTCHEKHVRCLVNYHTFWHGRVTSCTAVQPGCHMCDSQRECDDKHITRNIAVTHDLDGTRIVESAKFKCSLESNECVCKCDNHPTSAYLRGMVFSAKPEDGQLPGGLDHHVTRNRCSNLCIHHPECKGWQWETAVANADLHDNYHKDTGTCTLVDRLSPLVHNRDPTVMTYVAEKGNIKTGPLERRQKVNDAMGKTLCRFHEYPAKDSNGEYTLCKKCPEGKYSLHNFHDEGGDHEYDFDCTGDYDTQESAFKDLHRHR